MYQKSCQHTPRLSAMLAFALLFAVLSANTPAARAARISCPVSTAVDPFPLTDLPRYWAAITDGGEGDLDGVVNGSCELRVRYCLGSGEGHALSCIDEPIQSYEMRVRAGPDRDARFALEESILSRFALVFGGIEGPKPSMISFDPPVVPSPGCVDVGVQLPAAWRSGRLLLMSKIRLAPGHPLGTRTNKLNVMCLPDDPEATAEATCLAGRTACSDAPPPPAPPGAPPPQPSPGPTSGATRTRTPTPPAPTATPPPPGSGRTFYLSPSGSDVRSGLSPSTAWRSFSKVFNSQRPLQPGDTVVLLDGTYLPQTTGLADIDCGIRGNAPNGTASAPITIRAFSERKAVLAGDGSTPFSISNCSHYNIQGLYARNADNPDTPASGGSIFWLGAVNHVNLRRLLAVHPNSQCPRGDGSDDACNAHGIIIVNSTNVLVEESEVYDFHRHAIDAFTSRWVTLRRNYAHGRSGKSVSAVVLYGSNDSIIENTIIERGGQFSIIGIGIDSSIDPTRKGGRRNKILGSIALQNGLGFKIQSRMPSSGYMNARDNLLENVIAASLGSGNGVYLRGSAANTIRNATLYDGDFHGFNADDDGGVANSTGGTCDFRNPDGCSFSLVNVLAMGNARGGVGSSTHTCALDHVNAYANQPNYTGQASTCGTPNCSCTGRASTSPTGIGLGSNQCLAWIPSSSNMKRAGKSGADIGANVLYRYENGQLTSLPLWRHSDGRFLGCGAVVSGVNDNASNSCIGVHARLNVKTNGCSFPSGYVGW